MLRLFSVLLLLTGAVALFTLTRSNGELREDIDQLEAELGRMPIEEEDKVHIVAISNPRVPAEVASKIDRIWQFRCYLPANYDFLRMTGGGDVSDEGLYFQGGFSSSYGSAKAESHHELMTISLRRKEDHVECFTSFGRSSHTSGWNRMTSSALNSDRWVVETLVKPGAPARSFDQETILTILKIYDPDTKDESKIDGQSISTYDGGILVFCPKSREPDFDRLRKGKRPDGFDASWIAEGLKQ